MAVVLLVVSFCAAFLLGLGFERYVLGPLNVRLVTLRGQITYLEAKVRDEHEAL